MSRSRALTRAGPLLLAAGCVLTVFYPTCMKRSDSFPLSTYPMFAHPRGLPEIVQLLAVTDAQEKVPVPPHLVGSNEVLQAKVLLARVARSGKKKRLKFCRAVAQRALAYDESRRWVRLELVRSRFDPIEYFVGDGQPLSQQRLIQCRLPSTTSSIQPTTVMGTLIR